ncbi:hypothetical protein TNCV_1806451 [Trichonephila clavipes]|nr:hypothetical protein TNCV_1806451 [Trichonephila clavipes]
MRPRSERKGSHWTTCSTGLVYINLQTGGGERKWEDGRMIMRSGSQQPRSWSVESDLRVSLVNNGLVGPYSATVLVTLPSAPDHRPPRLESAR